MRNLIVAIAVVLVTVAQTVDRAASRAPVRAAKGMVGSGEQHASMVGLEILKKGGNAVDAAVAVGFALAVAWPDAGNIGGGGLMLIRFPDGRATAIDYREMAPGRAHRDMYLDEKGNPVAERSLIGPLAAGVPGAVAGLAFAQKKYGQSYARRHHGSGDRAGRQGIRRQRRAVGITVRRAKAAPAISRERKDLSQERRAVRTRRPPRPERSGRHAQGDRDGRTRRVLPRPHRGSYGGRDVAFRRPHHERGSGCVPSDRTRTVARHLSRIRSSRDAADQLRRCRAPGVPQHSRGISDRRSRAQLVGDDPCRFRSGQACLCRPLRVARRSSVLPRSRRRTDLEKIRGASPRRDQSRQGDAVLLDQAWRAVAVRIGSDDSLLRRRRRRPRGRHDDDA